ncbi:NAD(+) diphosphatase [Leucobacter denitrificans]|uniref:NAD(+) diphosphatase n=1 Tax=Leucobacter denitrificans TaxID=683042 RepID=A0A7G9S4W5_9MICO|nr:NAD(+) diphosphatase [Leucobacter denitrificans]QNN62890.1 NAD(+) diphosphatase [Leucobacter denitrificans]
MGAEQIPLAGSWIDRDVATRSSEAALEAAWNEPDARVLRIFGVNVPIMRGELSPRLELLPTAGFFAEASHRIYLGRKDGTPIFAVAIGDETQGGVTSEWIHPFEVSLELSPAERELVVIASALARWHESALWSARDGELTEWADGGWSRRDSRGGELFPRMDPAVIVLIEHEGKVLLGSNTLWESGRFSLLAGFVEAGESLEQAVAREIFEEAGVRLGKTRYMGSQPWPFPRSLMLGFRAQLAEGQDPDALVPDTQEISELRWFSREELADPPVGIRLPTKLSISGWLIADWVSEGDR